MARVKLSEYRAKKIFIGNQYSGLSFSAGDTINVDWSNKYVLKVDQGIKKRGKQGLVVVDVDQHSLLEHIKKWDGLGFDNYILDPLFPHETNEEHYLSVERMRDGYKLSYSPEGGVDIENVADSVLHFDLADVDSISTSTPLPREFINSLSQIVEAQHLSFVEFNPLVIKDGQIHILDVAALADSAGEYFASSWAEEDSVESGKQTEQEKAIKNLDDNSPAALKLKVVNPNGALWFLLSGGGASIAIADTVMAAGKDKELADYGEYSGGPSTQETYLYTKEVVSLALASSAPRKAIIIAGGVANFTDVSKTFAGIIQAFDEAMDEIKDQNFKVFVRRGGPNEVEGLNSMKNYLEQHDLLGSIGGSEIVLTDAVDDAIAWLGDRND